MMLSSAMVRRGAVAVLCLVAASLVYGEERSTSADAQPTEAQPKPTRIRLLDDTAFQRGFKVFDPATGRHVLKGILQLDPDRGAPAWNLVQWSSRFTLANANPGRLSCGSVRFADGAKSVTIGPASGPDRGLVLAINGLREYGPQLRKGHEPWAHLLAEQRFKAHPSLAELAELRFQVACRLLHSHAFPAPREAQGGQAAQFLAYLTVQNLNRQSSGYGDYYWFGIQMYDSRYRIPRRHAALDEGTGKFIFNPPGSVYANRSAHTGEWVTIDRDLLPLIGEGLKTAWRAGYLKESRDLEDLRLGEFNIGWELPGTLDVAVQVRDLRLEAVLRDEGSNSNGLHSRPARAPGDSD